MINSINVWAVFLFSCTFFGNKRIYVMFDDDDASSFYSQDIRVYDTELK
jgi:hypothetical protein